MDNIIILTNVLSFLDTRSLLHAQRVNHTWQHLIQSTSQLQQLLFRKPCGIDAPDQEITANPLLLWAFPIILPPPNLDQPWRKDSARLDQDRRTRKRRDRRQDDLPRTRLSDLTPPWPTITRKGASWRTMFTHQPPISKFELVHSYAGEGGSEIYLGSKIYTGNDGLRMGELYDHVSQECDKHVVVVERLKKMDRLDLETSNSIEVDKAVKSMGKSTEDGWLLRVTASTMVQCCVPTDEEVEQQSKAMEMITCEEVGALMDMKLMVEDTIDMRWVWEDLLT